MFFFSVEIPSTYYMPACKGGESGDGGCERVMLIPKLHSSGRVSHPEGEPGYMNRSSIFKKCRLSKCLLRAR